jgi:purine nucleoside phosphorylase
MLVEKGLDIKPTPRQAFILGTAWSDPKVLRGNGFKLDFQFTFSEVGIEAGAGAGHPNKFLFGTWHDKNVVISQGRVHLYQEHPGEESQIRKWMSILLALMDQGTRIVITSSVGGLSPKVRTGMVVQPTGLISAVMPMPYLNGNESEFVMSEHLLWINHREPVINRPLVQSTFEKAADHAGLFHLSEAIHKLVPGPGFAGATERRLWASWGCDTVGMSLDPELRIIELENMDNAGSKRYPSINVFAAFIVTDDHDRTKHDEICAEANKRTPQLGKFLSYVAHSEW